MKYCEICDKKLTKRNSTQHFRQCDVCYEREFDEWFDNIREERDDENKDK